MTNLGDLPSNAKIPTVAIADDAITSALIAASAVGSSEIADNAVTSSEIAADAVGTSEIAADAVTSSEIAADAVGTTEIAADAVTASEIAADAVGTSEIAADAVTSSEIAANAVGTSEIADDAVTSPKLNLTYEWLPPSLPETVTAGNAEVIPGSTSSAMAAGVYLVFATYSIEATSVDASGFLHLNYGLVGLVSLPIAFDLTSGQVEQRICTVHTVYTVSVAGASFYAALEVDANSMVVAAEGGLTVVRIG